MSDIYVMQRANGDVFALDHNGRFCVPLFHNSRDAMAARSRNGDMLLFKPVALDTRLLREITPKVDRNDVDLMLIEDPLRNLKRGSLLEHAELVLLVENQAWPALLDHDYYYEQQGAHQLSDTRANKTNLNMIICDFCLLHSQEGACRVGLKIPKTMRCREFAPGIERFCAKPTDFVSPAQIIDMARFFGLEKTELKKVKIIADDACKVSWVLLYSLRNAVEGLTFVARRAGR